MDEGEIDLLELLREEAHRTVDHQVETLDDIDSKVARILRINLLILGIILTGVSITGTSAAVEGDLVRITELVNAYTIGGLFFLLLSTGMAGITYTSSSLKAGVSREDLQTLLDNDLAGRKNLEGLVESYSQWIQYNYRTNAKNAPLGTFTVLLLVYSVTSLALGVKEAADGGVETWLAVLTVALLLAITYFAGFIAQVSRYNRVRKK